MKQVVMCLGRFGDVLNALPIAYEISCRGERPYFLIAKDFADILSSVSYVDPVVWDGDYAFPSKAILWYRKHHGNAPIITAQAYMHPSDRMRQTQSYQMESWRVAGCLPKFNTIPLVLDQRDFSRENALREQYVTQHPMILVAPASISSPYSKGEELVQKIREEYGPEFNIVDLRKVKAERIQDLLGLFAVADILITTDTVHLHLARASSVPVLAITNLAWKGSIPPPNTLRRADYGTPVCDILQGMEEILRPRKISAVHHVADIHGMTERHLRARRTWEGKFETSCLRSEWGRTAKSIGDSRSLPFLKDVLLRGTENLEENDVLVWCNDDVGLALGIIEWAQRHVSRWGAASMRRDCPHMGRDLFAFRADWLRDHFNEIPDFILGAPFWDLCLAAIIRRTRNVNSTKENLEKDIFPCETPDRFALHEDHPSEWAGTREHISAANLHNRRLALQWATKHMPGLRL